MKILKNIFAVFGALAFIGLLIAAQPKIGTTEVVKATDGNSLRQKQTNSIMRGGTSFSASNSVWTHTYTNENAAGNFAQRFFFGPTGSAIERWSFGGTSNIISFFDVQSEFDLTYYQINTRRWVYDASVTLDVRGTLNIDTANITNFTMGGTGSSIIGVKQLTNVSAITFDAFLPSITASNLLITPATNNYVWYGPTNVNLTNFVVLGNGLVSAPIVVQINNTNSASCNVLLPAQGAAHGTYSFSTNLLTTIPVASQSFSAPPGTNTIIAFRITRSNIVATVNFVKL